MVRAAANFDPTSALNTPTVFMPNGRPAPVLMTSEEVCELLRLPLKRGQDATKRLEYYRNKGTLRGVSMGMAVRFTLVEVLRFIDNQKEAVRC